MQWMHEGVCLAGEIEGKEINSCVELLLLLMYRKF
jgi:hypothetical protein